MFKHRFPLFEQAGEGQVGDGTPPIPPSQNQQDEELRRTVDEQRTELDRLRNLVTTNAAFQRPGQQPQQQQQGPTKEQVEQTFWKDPLSVVDAMSSRRAMEVAQQTVANAIPFETLIDVAKSRARETGGDPQLFDRLEPEIMAKVAQLPPQHRTNVVVWINAYNMAKGENFAKLRGEQSANRAPAIHMPGPAAPSNPASPAPKAAALSDDEKRFIRKFGLTEDEYNEGKEILKDQEKAWGEVLTFDSFEAKRRKSRAEEEKRRKAS